MLGIAISQKQSLHVVSWERGVEAKLYWKRCDGSHARVLESIGEIGVTPAELEAQTDEQMRSDVAVVVRCLQGIAAVVR